MSLHGFLHSWGGARGIDMSVLASALVLSFTVVALPTGPFVEPRRLIHLPSCGPNDGAFLSENADPQKPAGGHLTAESSGHGEPPVRENALSERLVPAPVEGLILKSNQLNRPRDDGVVVSCGSSTSFDAQTIPSTSATVRSGMLDRPIRRSCAVAFCGVFSKACRTCSMRLWGPRRRHRCTQRGCRRVRASRIIAP